MRDKESLIVYDMFLKEDYFDTYLLSDEVKDKEKKSKSKSKTKKKEKDKEDSIDKELFNMGFSTSSLLEVLSFVNITPCSTNQLIVFSPFFTTNSTVSRSHSPSPAMSVSLT